MIVLPLAFMASIAHAAPATQPTAKAAERAKALNENSGSFRLELWYQGEQDKPYYALTLAVRPIQRRRSSPFQLDVQISEAQAKRIIDHLAAEGFLDQAIDAENKAIPAPPGSSYTIKVIYIDQAGRHELHSELGFDLNMLKRLDGLRAVLEGDAAKQMDFLLVRLSGHRRQWESAAPTTMPAAQKVGTKASMKGWELYIFQQDGDTYFSLLPGTNRLKSDAEITNAAVKGIEAIKSKLDELKTGEMVFIRGLRLPDAPPANAGRETASYCSRIGLKAQ